MSADRSNFHEGRDYNDRLRETRPKTRSRSPLHPKVNRQNHEQSNSQARSGRRDRGARIERGDRGYVESRSKLSIEQSVRDRGYPSVAAVQVMQDAESQNHQTQLFDNPNEQPNQALAKYVLLLLVSRCTNLTLSALYLQLKKVLSTEHQEFCNLTKLH